MISMLLTPLDPSLVSATVDRGGPLHPSQDFLLWSLLVSCYLSSNSSSVVFLYLTSKHGGAPPKIIINPLLQFYSQKCLIQFISLNIIDIWLSHIDLLPRSLPWAPDISIDPVAYLTSNYHLILTVSNTEFLILALTHPTSHVHSKLFLLQTLSSY